MNQQFYLSPCGTEIIEIMDVRESEYFKNCIHIMFPDGATLSIDTPLTYWLYDILLKCWEKLE